MNDQEAYEFHLDPANRVITGKGRKHPKDRLTAVLSVRVSPSLLAQVRGAAEREGRSAGSWVRRALRAGLRADEIRRREAALAGTARVLGGRAVPRPLGLIAGSGRAGEPKALWSAPSQPGTFSCPHMSISGVTSASCGECGPLPAAS